MNSFQWDWNAWGNPVAQTETHQMMCFALAAITLLAIAWRTWGGPSLFARRLSGPSIVLAIIAAALAGLFLLYCAPDFRFYGGFGLLGILVLQNPLLHRSKWLNPVYTIITVALLIWWVIPAFFIRLDYSGQQWKYLIHFTAHYNGVLGVGDRLVAGQHLFRDAIPLYGEVWPLVTAAWDLWLRPMTIMDYCTLIRIVQTFYVAIGAYCLYRVSGRYKVIFLLTAALGACHYQFNACAWQLYPNQSAIRHLGAPIAILLMILVRNRSIISTPLILGLGAGLCLLLNTEVGIAAAIALAAYIFFQLCSRCVRHSFSVVAGAVVMFFVGIVAAALAFLIAHRIVLGYWVQLEYLPAMFQWIATSKNTGFNSLQDWPFRSIAVLMFAHSAAALIYSAAVPKAWTGPRNSLRGGVAVFLLLWFAYWANHPAAQYLFCYNMPYGILLADTFRALAAIRRYRVSTISVSAVAAVLFVIGPYFYIEFSEFIMEYNGEYPYQFNAHKNPVAQISDIFVPGGAYAERIKTKAAFISKLDEPSPVYLSADDFFIIEQSHKRPNIPIFDAFVDCITRTDYDRMMRWIINSKSKTIYIDVEADMTDDGILPGEKEYYRACARICHTISNMAASNQGGNAGTAAPPP